MTNQQDGGKPPAGYNGAILWIDLAKREWALERRPEIFFRRYPGGGLLATRLLLERTTAGIDALSPGNLLMFCS